MRMAKDQHLMIARHEPVHVIVTTAHATLEEARAHAQHVRTRHDGT